MDNGTNRLPDSFPDDAEVVIPSGVYHLDKPVVLRSRNLRVIGDGRVVIRGTMPVRMTGGVFHVTGRADGFYVGDRRYTMARYPKATDPDAPFGGYAADCFEPEKTSGWKDPRGGYLHAMHRHMWGGYSYRINGKDEDGRLILSGGWQNNRQMGMHDEYRFAENIREEMTEPGEWYYNGDEGTIEAILCPGDDQEKAEAAVSDGLFILDGCENVTFENIVFERTSRTFMDTREPLLCSDWTIARKGAVLIRNSERCSIDRCEFRDIGSNAVFVDGRCADISVTRTWFSDIGASGVCFVGRSDSVRMPMYDYSRRITPEEIDKTPGPASGDYPRSCLVEDCLIENTGTTEKQSAGVEISMAYGVTVRNCTVCHTPRAGINISEGTFGGHMIDGCDVFDTVRETGDHGSFNSWGRDRFWHLDDTNASRVYSSLDMLSPNTIRNSRFRCDHGWDIDLDDGSSNYVIENNLCLRGGLKLREGYNRAVRRNVTIGNTIHTHAWYPDSGDVIEENIVFAPYSVYSMPEKWGDSVDHNILCDPNAGNPSHADALSDISGQDLDSIARKVTFDGDSLKPLDIPGFEDFPTEFGVRYPPLRKKAGSPVMPETGGKSEAKRVKHEPCRYPELGLETS